MKRKISAFSAIMIIMQLLLSSIVTVNAETTGAIGEEYTVPESPSVTYNMNLDWRFFQTSSGYEKDIWESMAEAEKNGVAFYEKDYDDSDWESVSIPHAPGAQSAFNGAITDSGQGWRGVLLYRKTFTVPSSAAGGKVFFELDGIRQAAYVWVNGEKVGYYEAGITAMGFDLTSFITPGEETVIAILNDCTTARGTTGRVIEETVPGQEWGSSYMTNKYETYVGDGVMYSWNTKDFNEPQAGLVYDAYLHVKGGVYQTLPLYNNLKTTGNYIYASDFNIRENKAKINVKAEVRNESNADGNYTLEVAVTDHEGKFKYSFESEETAVKAATDAGVVYQTAVEKNVYDENVLENTVGQTKVNTVDVSYINASFDAENLRFWTTDDPYLYTVYTILKDSNGTVVDVQKKETGFRKVTYDSNQGVLINDKPVWLTGYAQRSTNEWAVIGVASDWLQDYDMKLMKENNTNFIRWMHVAPKPSEVRSADRYGVAIVCPAGDKEGTGLSGRQWAQRTEAMRDAMIYFRNNPSILFWETGNSSVGSAEKANEMAQLRDEIDPYGMRFIGARSTTEADQMNYDYNYAGTMYGNYASKAISAMKTNGIPGPIMETEYARDESPRRIWDRYSPPDYDYVNKYLGDSRKKEDGYDYWDLTQEEITVNNVKEYNSYYDNRAGNGKSLYSAEAMMVWADSVMHGRNSGSENCRTSGRVDGVRQTKQMYDGMTVAKSSEPAVHIIGHWSYPQVSDDTYNYYASAQTGVTGDGQKYTEYDTNTVLKRDPTTKTVYAVGSIDISKIELYRVDGEEETLIGTDSSAEQNFLYQFDNIDVTKGDAVLAKAYNARGEVVATHEIKRTYDAKSVKLEANISPDGWRADGSDIAYVDVKVVDENGNVCALNYDKINFTYSGNGVYLGGYNSGMGSGCFQNSMASTGVSKYFGGAKDGVSTLGMDYVYAENGTNRIFIRSTRNAGAFTLTAAMDGMLPTSITINSEEVKTEGGLTTQLQSTMAPGVSAAPITSSVQPLKPLMLTKALMAWADIIIERETDAKVYYNVKVNGENVFSANEKKAYLGNMNSVFGSVLPVLEKLKSDGAPFTYTYDTSGEKAVLTFVAGGHTYTVTEGTNFILTDGSNPNEIVQDAEIVGGDFYVSYLAVLGYIPGVAVSQNNSENVINISYSAE